MRSLFFILLAATTLTGCARQIDSTVYSERDVGRVAESYAGVVLSVRQVTVKTAEKLEENAAGGLLGGVVGGVAGSNIGKGKGADAAAVGGAILGAVAGALIQDQLGTQTGLEYTIKLVDERNDYTVKKTGKTNEKTTFGRGSKVITVVQGMDAPISIGQRVYVLVDEARRSRVVADPTSGRS